MNIFPSSSSSSTAIGTVITGPLIAITASTIAQKLLNSEDDPARGVWIHAVSAYAGAQTAAALATAQSWSQNENDTWKWVGLSATATALCLGIFYYQTAEK